MQNTNRGISKRHAFTLLELLAVIFVLLLVLALLLPILSGRRPAYQMQSATQLGAIHQSLVIYSEGNNGWYPGFDSTGNLIDPSTEYRFQALVETNHFSGQYMINPMETATVWTDGPVTSANYSYAMLQINDATKDAGRRAEWRNTNNAEAAMMSDRNIGVPPQYESLFTDTVAHPSWPVVWNDNHLSFEPSHLLATTKYDDAAANASDNLFEAVGPNDAMMTFSRIGENIVGRRPPLNRGSERGAWAVIFLLLGFIAGLITMTLGNRIRHKPPPAGTMPPHETSQR